MRKRDVLPLSLIACLAPSTASAGPKRDVYLETSSTQVHLIELYSSEGCSSCPPADEWMAGLRSNPRLWHSFIPVEFHVDYWNRLGWNDRFSREDFTRRQSEYSSEWGRDSVYTPGRVLDGMEWRETQDLDRLGTSGKKVGKLIARRISETRFRVRFSPEIQGDSWIAYGALLGNGLKTQVKAGENSGRTLRHEFVAFTLTQSPMKMASGAFEVEIELKAGVSKLMNSGASSTSVAVWVAREGSQTPVQAVGGDLPSD